MEKNEDGEHMEIVRAERFPVEAFEPLFEESRAEGWRHLTRLREDWLAGTNRFDGPGEALFVGWHEGALIGVAGLNVDPHSANGQVGRIRRVYVRAANRGDGHGRALVGSVVAHARIHFHELHLRAGSPAAAKFFEAMGFERASESSGEVTHRLVLLGR